MIFPDERKQQQSPWVLLGQPAAIITVVPSQEAGGVPGLRHEWNRRKMKGSQCSQPNEQRGPSRCEGPGGHEGRNWIWIWRSVSPAAGPGPASISVLWLSLWSGDKAQAGGRSRVESSFLLAPAWFPLPGGSHTDSVLTKVRAQKEHGENGLTLIHETSRVQ